MVLESPVQVSLRSEVEDLHLAVRGEEDVVGLDVAVDDAVVVQVLERVAHLDGDPERLLARDRDLAAHEGAERLPLHVLHGHVHLALVAGLQDPDDVGVAQRLPDLLLAPEALGEDDVALVLQVRDLERDGLAGARVGGLEDGGHPAPRQEVRELVLVEPVADGGLAHQAALALEDMRREPSACADCFPATSRAVSR
jgi:hypothetical protein